MATLNESPRCECPGFGYTERLVRQRILLFENRSRPTAATGDFIMIRRYEHGPLLAAILALLLWSSDGAAAPSLSPEETRIVAWIDAHEEAAVERLEQLVNINSGTLNLAGVREVGEELSQDLADIGFEVRWDDLPPEMNRAGHLYAERRGNQGQRVLLIGHLDTVFEPDHPFQQFTRDGDTGHGPGVADMKGGNIAIVYALMALASVGALDNTTIRVIMTGDEERPGKPHVVSRASLIEAARNSDAALGFESGSRDGERHYGVVARRSASTWKLVVTGVQAHSSRIFSETTGSGAIFEAARILNAFHEQLRGEPYLTFNAGVILGGTDVALDEATSSGSAYGKNNVVPQSAVVTGGIRTLTVGQLETARATMRTIVSKHHPRTGASILFADGYPPMSPAAGNTALLELMNEINRDLGAPRMAAFDPGRRGAADISFAAPHVESALAGLGAFGDGAHSPEETIDLDLLPLVVKRTALLVYRLTRAPTAE
jgi:glutamate carboxypeptidase